MHFFPRSILLATVVGLLASCAQSPMKTTGVAVDEARIAALYAEVNSAIAAGESGLLQYAAGNVDAASASLTSAREVLTASASQCASIPGCEIERVLAAQDALIAQQTMALLGQLNVDDNLDPAPAGERTSETNGSPVLRMLPEAARSIDLLKGQDLRTLIADNEPLRAALKEWLTWMRPFLLEAHENYQFMRYRMYPEYEKAGLPEALLFGILAKESGAKVHAVSRAGASGPLQFMYYTGRRFGLGVENGFDQRFDPASAARANVAYISEQLLIFNNNLELVLGAYNGGEGRMQRLSGRGARGFWDPQVFNQLPPETRDYVPMVLAAAWLFMHADEYNLTLPALDVRPGEITLVRPTSLNELAICLGQQGNARGWFRTLRNLNPRYEPTTRIAAGTRLELPVIASQAYTDTCISGPLVEIASRLQDARLPSGPGRIVGTGRTHLVRKGETLSSIARKFGCSGPRTIAAANRIKAPRYAIREGQKLVVPAC